jgi:hypothetical protein
MVVSVFSSLACLLALLGLLFGLIWYALLGDVGVGVAGHTLTACSDLDMSESDSMDRDVIVIVFCVTESNASYVVVGKLCGEFYGERTKKYRPTSPYVLFFFATRNDFVTEFSNLAMDILEVQFSLLNSALSGPFTDSEDLPYDIP